MAVFTFPDVDSGLDRTYATSAEPGVLCVDCQGLFGRTFHPAGRPCGHAPRVFYVSRNGALRLRSMMHVYGTTP